MPDQLCLAIESAISRHPGEHVERFRDARCFLAKVDIGAYGEPAVKQDSRAVSMVVGEPLLGPAGRRGRTRTDDLDALHRAGTISIRDQLKHARGVFAAVHYDRSSETLLLITDKLGIRPVYYWLGPRWVIFANALRVIEQIPEAPKIMDLRGVTEIASIGFPLGSRTPFESVELLRSAEVLRIRAGETTREEYWRWDDIPVSERPAGDLAEEAYRCFSDAVTLRCRDDTSTVAFLSGGLDSRAIVTLLRASGVTTHTFNISHPGTQDAIYGEAFARRTGAIHTQVSVPRGQTRHWAQMLAQAWRGSPHRIHAPATRPGLVWSGDGGSVGIGHVYLDGSIVSLARQGRAGLAVRAMSRAWGGAVPARLLQPKLAHVVRDVVAQGWLDELALLRCADAGRCMHVLLMQNDQRRHLSDFFENIDLHRLEYHLPFFDSEFLSIVMQVPIEECLGHRFYMKWLEEFPDVTLSVPWQTYPGHEPCPLPPGPEFKYQWGAAHGRDVREARRRDLLAAASRLLSTPDFPTPLLRRGYVRLAALLYRFRLRDVGYFLEAARLYADYWSRSAGKYSLPNARPAVPPT